MIEDIIKSIKAHLYDRTASPLFGAFVISWLLWNHRFIMAIVFGNGLQEKYEMMDKAINGAWSQCILFPLITALLYIFAYPYPARWIYGFSKRQQEKLNSIKNEIESNRLLTVEESRKLIAQHTLMENEYQDTINRLNLTITTLKSNIESNDNLINEKEISNNELKNDITRLSKSINTLESDLKSREKKANELAARLEEMRSKLPTSDAFIIQDNSHNKIDNPNIYDIENNSIKILKYLRDEGKVELDNIFESFRDLGARRCEYLLNKLVKSSYVSVNGQDIYTITNKGLSFLKSQQ